MHQPHFDSHWNRGPLAAAALLVLCVCAGCPTGTYREQMQERGREVARHTPGGDLLADPLPLPETQLQIRVPKCFTQEAFQPDGPQNIQRKRLELPLPGHLYTYEAHVDHEGSKLPYYCCLAVAGEDPTGGILKQIKQMYPSLDVKWEDRAAGSRTWRKLRVDIEQDWIPLDSGGKEMPSRTLPGILEFDCIQDGGKWIIVGWRVPRVIQGTIKLDRAIGPTLASLEGKPQ